jgi:hypothetical protein
MRDRRVKAIALATQNVGVSPLLPLAGGLLIMLFAVSLAIAEPGGVPVAAARGDITTGFASQGGLESDSLTTADTTISSRPAHGPRFPDRYEFYHRYDHGLVSRYSPLDDGLR